jgi:hypothetical protein
MGYDLGDRESSGSLCGSTEKPIFERSSAVPMEAEADRTAVTPKKVELLDGERKRLQNPVWFALVRILLRPTIGKCILTATYRLSNSAWRMKPHEEGYDRKAWISRCSEANRL